MYKDVSGDTFRLIPSCYPPIRLFENLLDPNELDAAYALESLTNDRLRDEVGDISLVPPEDRLVGPGTSPIMAAFTHAGVPSRFTNGRFGGYYAGLDIETATAEAKNSRARFLRATDEAPQVVTMRCYKCEIESSLVDLRNDRNAHDLESYAYSQALGEKLKGKDEMGILYNSVRRSEGQCVAILRPTALIPPATQTAHFNFYWDGNAISHVTRISEC